MIIGISYYVGENQEQRSFETYEDTILFIKKCVEVFGDEFFHVEFNIYNGEEEKRIRGLKNG